MCQRSSRETSKGTRRSSVMGCHTRQERRPWETAQPFPTHVNRARKRGLIMSSRTAQHTEPSLSRWWELLAASTTAGQAAATAGCPRSFESGENVQDHVGERTRATNVERLRSSPGHHPSVAHPLLLPSRGRWPLRPLGRGNTQAPRGEPLSF